MAALTPEGKVKQKVTKMLKQYKLWFFSPAANGMGRAGIPDIIAIVAGQFVSIEAKADKTKKPTMLQAQCGRQIIDAGGQWFLVYDDQSLAVVEQYIQKATYDVSSGTSQGPYLKAE